MECKPTYKQTPMALNFSNKILVTNPTSYYLGGWIIGAGLLALLACPVTLFTGEVLLPPMAWCALGVPTSVIGGIFVMCGLTRA
jgi:hypothetical protein